MFVSDLRHFLDLPDDVPGPARRMAAKLSLIVRAATAGDSGLPWVSALSCDRRPGRQPCGGHLAIHRTEIPPSVAWWCTSCGDEGVISGWERSPYDLRRHGLVIVPDSTRRIVVPLDVAATFRDLQLIDGDIERLIFRAEAADDGAALVGDVDDWDELLGYLAAEANHEGNRRRQRRLDEAFEVVHEAVEHGG